MNFGEVTFPTSIEEIENRIDQIDPVKYGSTRNFVDGAVTGLSPYISRGVISTAYVAERIEKRGFDATKITKFLQELAWRDYWQNKLVLNGLPSLGLSGGNLSLPISVLNCETGITAIDDAVRKLYESGYMHNHVRMYVAAIIANFGKYDWQAGAKWFYYHLFDGDIASNTYSWQWVAGIGRSKKYIMNQENINKYFYTDDRNTFLDDSYEALSVNRKYEELKGAVLPTLEPPKFDNDFKTELSPGVPTLVYNYYNLDPYWHAELEANRVLLLEPEKYANYPIGPKAMSFAIELSKNINGIQTFVGSFKELQALENSGEIVFKEHPLNFDYLGREEPRDWIHKTETNHRSFFSFWKELNKDG